MTTTFPVPPLAARVRLFRRRLWLIAFVRTWPAATAVAVMAAAAAALAIRRLDGDRVALLVGAMIVATVFAAVAARRRTGGIADAAATLDRRFGLANRIVTALEFGAQGDDVARLIAEDAASRLGRRRPEDLPLEAPRHLGWIVTGFIVLAVAFVAAGRSTTTAGDAITSQGVLADGAGAPTAIGGRTATAPSSSRGASAVAGDERRLADARSEDPLTPSSPKSGAAADVPPRRADAGDAQPSASSSPSPSSSPPSAPSRDSAAVSSPRRTAALSGSDGRSPGREAAAAAAASSGRERATGDDRGAGAGATGVRGTASGAGGVSGAAAQRSPDESQVHGRSNEPRETAAAAWNRAESALARERLPVGLRGYVHDYLVAIRPGSRP